MVEVNMAQSLPGTAQPKQPDFRVVIH